MASIVKDNARGTFYISYHLPLPDGTNKVVSIRNKDWKLERGIRYMQRIVQQVVDEDMAKRAAYSSLAGRKACFGEAVDAYVAEEYRTKKRQTAYNKELACNAYIRKYLRQDVSCDESLTVQSISIFQNKVCGLGYGPSRTNYIIGELRAMLGFLADREYIPYEKAHRLMSILKGVKQTAEKITSESFWTPEQYDSFASTFEPGDKWKVFFDVAYFGALRISEIIALQWKDANFARKTISINKSMDASGNITTTKNNSSNASVSLPTKIIDEMAHLMDEGLYEADDFMFFGKRVSRTTIRRAMDSHADKAGLEHMKFHGLRHSMASRMINAGLNPVVVSKHLRHSSTQQTLDTYSHLFPNLTEGVMDNI